jgi:hypothetical protein
MFRTSFPAFRSRGDGLWWIHHFATLLEIRHSTGLPSMILESRIILWML